MTTVSRLVVPVLGMAMIAAAAVGVDVPVALYPLIAGMVGFPAVTAKAAKLEEKPGKVAQLRERYARSEMTVEQFETQLDKMLGLKR